MRFLKEVDNRPVLHRKRRNTWNLRKRSVYTIVDKETVLEYINIIKTDGPIYLRYLKTLEDLARKHNLKVLVELTESKRWKSDADFFKDFEKFVVTIINKSNELATVIRERLPENYNFYSSNLNIAVSTFMLYLGRFVIDLPVFLDNVSSMYDIALGKKETLGGPVTKTVVRRMLQDFNYLVATGLTKDKYIEEIIETIGDYPAGDKLNKNIPLKVKEEIISNVVGNNKIGKYITGFLTSFKTATDHTIKKFFTETRNKNITYGFSGNPIYYIRKIIADLEINGYEKRKLERKKLELKVQYLKEKANKEMDPKKVEIYKKQIEILEQKIERLEAKEKAFLDKLEKRS